jgi:uncharacterized membrane protein
LNDHALLWSGTAGSAVDLNPAGVDNSYAYATGGTRQVGYGSGTATGFNAHALLWSGTAASTIDLNPTGFGYSYALGTNDAQQVGFGSGFATGNNNHALLWSGTAGSLVDLGALLPAGTFLTSIATTVSGNTIYGYATDTAGNYHAIAWTVPEPTSAALAGVAALGLLARRRRT